MSLGEVIRRVGGHRRTPAVDGSLPASDGAADRAAADRLDLRWEDIPAAETHLHPDGISELFDRRRDGVTVRGVYTPEEAARAVRNLAGMDLTPHGFGAVLGASVGMTSGEPEDRQRYYDDVERCRRMCTEAFGFDPHRRLADVLAPMAAGRPLVPPAEAGRPYNPGQVRVWEPGQGGLQAHVGNEFGAVLRQTAMRHLVSVTEVVDHLSYFVVLQGAEEGGVLSVLDLTWEEDDASGRERFTVGRDDSALLGLPSRPIAADAGDLVLFGGGWRWHRVSPPTGSSPRVTYGGFCGPSVDGTEINFWA